MEVAFTECIPVTDQSSVGEVRRTALAVGQRLEFDERRAGELALLATEVSRNVLIHGGGGEVIVAGMKDQGKHLARILALDKGPGIASLPDAMADGFSTSGTMGGGLGAMKRIASGLEVFSGPAGTIVLLEIGESRQMDDLEVAGFAVPYPGERACGDGWMIHRTPQKMVVLLVDGIGHGLGAAAAAFEAINAFKLCAELGPGEILPRLHDALRKTRGAVAAVAEIRPSENVVIYSGVGNIAASVIEFKGSRSLVSHNGTLGSAAPKIQEFRTEWSRTSTLVMHSDGLQTRWDLSAYAGLASRHPALIGGALLRDFRRHRDDASVVVVKGK
jgi:anti-sigma regulatory factor (Ser/Thr protein kinase)